MRVLHPVRDESGAALVEFALSISVFLLLLAGLADFAFYIHYATELQDAAAAGAYYGTIPGNQTNGTYMQASAKAAAPDLGSNIVATPTTFYACTPGGAHVLSTASCTNLVNGTAYGTPIMYVDVKTQVTSIPAILQWTGISSSLTLKGEAIYRVPWVSQ
jgi:Flp pilus assembly protein TadG